MKTVKLALIACATFAFAGTASACPLGKAMTDKSAEAPIEKPVAGS